MSLLRVLTDGFHDFPRLTRPPTTPQKVKIVKYVFWSFKTRLIQHGADKTKAKPFCRRGDCPVTQKFSTLNFPSLSNKIAHFQSKLLLFFIYPRLRFLTSRTAPCFSLDSWWRHTLLLLVICFSGFFFWQHIFRLDVVNFADCLPPNLHF